MRDTVVRVLLAALAVTTAVVGVWAQFAPRAFYDDFPGWGRHWVAVDGPYNEHLVRDVGGLNLALTVLLVAALVTLRPTVVRVAAVAYLIFAVPHLVYHLHHLEGLDTVDQVGNVVSLASAVLAPIVVLALTWPGTVPQEPRAAAPATPTGLRR